MTDDSSFASRWSRRKKAVEEEAIAEELEKQEEAVVEVEPEEVPEKTDEEVLAEFNLKDPDELKAGDDFSGFMNSAIPQRLRNRALRKLWVSNPALANLDELLDYGEDFNKGGEVIENIATAYKVGKGFVDKLAEDEVIAPESETSESEDSSEDVVDLRDDGDSKPINNVRKPDEVRVKEALPTESELAVAPEISSKPAETRRKRMNFKF